MQCSKAPFELCGWGGNVGSGDFLILLQEKYLGEVHINLLNPKGAT